MQEEMNPYKKKWLLCALVDGLNEKIYYKTAGERGGKK